MENTQQYGIVKATLILPTRDLLRVPHREGVDLTVSHPAFGPNPYSGNLAEMQKTYFHSNELPRVSFRGPTTSESISACAYDFKKLAKPQILDLRWFQLGRILRASEGVFINPPKDNEGNAVMDESSLKSFLTGDKKFNGIYLLGNDFVRDFAFVPCESFTTGEQDSDTFARGGLARGLEYVAETEAPKFKLISSKQNYPRGVNVLGFDKVQKPLLRVASLDSGRGLDSGGLDVGGSSWVDNGYGYAFGVF